MFYLHLSCNRYDAPPKSVGNYQKDTKRMKHYLKKSGVDVFDLVWSVDGFWEIDVSGSEITDVSWAETIPIHKLKINNTLIKDLAPLRSQTTLRWLEANDTPISDLSPLSGISTFETLDIRNTLITNIDSISMSSIMFLDIRGTKISDISSLRLDQLKNIDFDWTNGTSYKGIDRLRSIERISINGFADSDQFWEAYDSLKIAPN